MTAAETRTARQINEYVLDDASSFYHGRRVLKMRELGGDRLPCVVRVIGTKVEFVTTQWQLAAGESA